MSRLERVERTSKHNVDLSAEERAVWAALGSDIRFGARHFHHLLSLGIPVLDLWKNTVTLPWRNTVPTAMSGLFDEIRRSVDPMGIMRNLARRSIRLITIRDQEYPELLRELSIPPAILYVRGSLGEDSRIVVVGTRKMSPYGRRVTQDLVQPLAQSGLTIVSGLALGIDGMAHRAALEAGGITWAILPGGVDEPYPASHGPLATNILAKGGALISEFPPGTDALRHHFPIRNRIIAGLAKATLVIEAAERSGTLLTARSALEANRDVYTIPGSIYAPGSAGPHRLIQLGAKLIHSAEDILLELGLENAQAELQTRAIIPDSPEEKAVLDVLGSEPLLLDDLIDTIDLDSATVMSTLTLMEMKGKVRHLGGTQYVRR